MVTSTGFSGLFDTIQPTGHTLLDTDPQKQRLAKILRRNGARELNELMLTLNGAAAGEAALKQYSRVQFADDVGNPVAHGGARTIETVTVINRVSAAADETAIDGILNETFAPSTYIEDAAGNGGGSQLDEQQNL